jgi:hypothetical protein
MVSVGSSPFAGFKEWLRSRNFLLTDKQTCFRLFVFIAHHARTAGVPETQLADALRQEYHPRARREVEEPAVR